MYYSLICTMHATLILCNIVEMSLLEDNVYNSQIHWITNFSYTYFQLA